MEEPFANLRRIDFTWGRRTKKLKLRREEVPPLNDSPSHPIFEIPFELTLNIISFLNPDDVLSLGCCSKLLNKLCNNDSLWKFLYQRRWPNHLEGSQISCEKSHEGWKDSYISKHKAITAIFSDHFSWCDKCECISLRRYRNALSILSESKFGFEDVCLLFRRKMSVHINLIGLHYALLVLGVSSKDVIGALSRYQVSDRRVSVRWSFYDHYSLAMSLNEIANGDQTIFYFLEFDHGTITELRWIRISSVHK